MKCKDNDLVPDGNSASSTLLNTEEMAPGSEEDGYKGLDLNAE